MYLHNVDEVIVSNKDRFDGLIRLLNVLEDYSIKYNNTDNTNIYNIMTSIWMLLMRLPTQVDAITSILNSVDIDNPANVLGLILTSEKDV